MCLHVLCFGIESMMPNKIEWFQIVGSFYCALLMNLEVTVQMHFIKENIWFFCHTIGVPRSNDVFWKSESLWLTTFITHMTDVLVHTTHKNHILWGYVRNILHPISFDRVFRLIVWCDFYLIDFRIKNGFTRLELAHHP